MNHITAIHEAGHVVIAVRVGETFSRVSVFTHPRMMMPGTWASGVVAGSIDPADCDLLRRLKALKAAGALEVPADLSAEVWASADRCCMSFLGGPIAESHYVGRAISFRNDEDVDDLRRVQSLLKLTPDPEERLKRLVSETEELVRENWPAILAIADALLESKTLEYSEVIAIVDGRPSP